MGKSDQHLTAARLRELLSYDPLTGRFTRRIDAKHSHAGSEPGTVHKHGYRVIGVDGRKYPAHRLAWLYVHGHFPADEVDHIDRNRLNNAIGNLRHVTRQENCRNRSPVAGSASRYVGVAFRKDSGRWTAQIRVNGKNHHLGYFDREDDARDAYLAAKPRFHPIMTYAKEAA